MTVIFMYLHCASGYESRKQNFLVAKQKIKKKEKEKCKQKDKKNERKKTHIETLRKQVRRNSL